MKALNSVIMEGNFAHFTSKKGSPEVSFMLYNNNNSYRISTNGMLGVLAKNYKRGCKLRVVGRLEKIGRSVIIKAERLDLIPKTNN